MPLQNPLHNGSLADFACPGMCQHHRAHEGNGLPRHVAEREQHREGEPPRLRQLAANCWQVGMVLGKAAVAERASVTICMLTTRCCAVRIVTVPTPSEQIVTEPTPSEYLFDQTRPELVVGQNHAKVGQHLVAFGKD